MNDALNLVIFGATGDLTFRKLLPALYNLEHGNHLAGKTRIIVIGRQPFDSDSYREKMWQWIGDHARFKVSKRTRLRFHERVSYLRMDFNEASGYPQLARILRDAGLPVLYYFAVAPASFTVIGKALCQAKIARPNRVIIEKPFGDNLESAIDINRKLAGYFGAGNIFRIDHYLAKEMIQNILATRFANDVFANLFNHMFVDNIQITAAETVGVENRGNYYDHHGALEDMVQNHLLQVLSMITMDEPASLEAHDIQHEQARLLKKVRFPSGQAIIQDVVKGQYHVTEETEENRSYLHENRVQPDSQTETYVALRVGIDNARWRNVPIYIRTGKRMHKRSTEVAVVFKRKMYGNILQPADVLLIKIQPDEGIYFRINVKKPGMTRELEPVFMEFCQSCIYENKLNTPEAYERLLLAAMHQDHALFTSWEFVRRSWSLIEHFEQEAAELDVPLHLYESGSTGPQAADELLRRDGHAWVDEQVYREVVLGLQGGIVR